MEKQVKKIWASGNNNIQVPQRDEAGNLTGHDEVIFIEEGKEYDLSEYPYAFVCGKKYKTTRNGDSNPFNAAGKKIKIVKHYPGDAYYFTEVALIVLE